jgi:3-hydroxypropanoate dehydrogenase
MPHPISDEALAQIYRDARTHSAWLDRPVEDATLRALYELARMPPTSANCSPMRLVFVKSPEAKERLRPALSAGNLEKTMTAPVTAIVAYDTRFYDELTRLFPHVDARAWFTSNAELAQITALRNGSLQGGYLILAARSLGLDCGPMSGFDNATVDREFFPDGRWRSNFLLNIGYGDPDRLRPRNPRLEFEEACKIV